MAVERHEHNNTDSPKIPYRNLGGIPTNAGVPDWDDEIGKLVYDTTNNRLYIRTATAWRYMATT